VIVVDASHAPAILRYRLTTDPFDPEELAALRRRLQRDQLLTRATRLLVDSRAMGDMPTMAVLRRVMGDAESTGVMPAAIAFLVTPGLQVGVISQVMAILPDAVQAAVFTDETEAEAFVQYT
jgi:hypothetical protein